MRRKISVIVAMFIFCITIYGGLHTEKAYGNEGEAHKELDFIFVIDGSYSMNANDPDQNIFSILTQLTTEAEENGCRVGYVVYNDSIVIDKDLANIKNRKQVKKIVKELKKVSKIKWSDVGFGMKAAHRNLVQNGYRKNQTAMIILSDGDIEVNENDPNRTQKACNTDIEQVLEQADYPVYTIQYSEEEVKDKSPMNTWGKLTGGIDYSIQKPKDLLDAAEEIYERQLEQAVESHEEAQQEKAAVQHEIQVPVSYSEEELLTHILITLETDETIEDVIIPTEYENISTSREEGALTLTITEPELESYTLFYKTSDGEPVSYHIVSKTEPIAESFWEKWGMAVIIVFLILAAAGIGTFTFFRIKNKNKQYYFTDALECYIMKTKTNEDYPIQNWGSEVFQRKRKVSLYYFMRKHPLQEDASVYKQIDIAAGYKNSLDITSHTTKVVLLHNGLLVNGGNPCTIRAGQSVYLTFLSSGVEMELRVRKVNRR